MSTAYGCNDANKTILEYYPGVPFTHLLELKEYNAGGSAFTVPYDLTNATVVIHFRVNKDSTKYFELSTNRTNLLINIPATDGDITINLSAAETSQIYDEFISGVFDVQVTDNNTGEVFSEVIYGTFIANKTVTRLGVPGEAPIN